MSPLYQHPAASRAAAAPVAPLHLNIAVFAADFPEQAVVCGQPNRARRAAHCARGAEIARRSGNRALEAAWLAWQARLQLAMCDTGEAGS